MPENTRTPRSLATRRRLATITGTFAILGVTIISFRSAGSWLVVEDTLQPAGAVAVLGGGAPVRAIEAADVYKLGLAAEVWLTRGRISHEHATSDKPGSQQDPEYVVAARVLERHGVPSTAIRVLAAPTPNTIEEVRTIAREVEAVGGYRVILITSKYHTRRVKIVWQRIVGARPAAIIRHARQDGADPLNWWRRKTDRMQVSREWVGVLNALAGFPMTSSQ